jgi:GH18 family chitinase
MNQTAPYFTPVQNMGFNHDNDSASFQWGWYSCTTTNYQSKLISRAHAAGCKVVIAINAVDPRPGFNFVATDSVRTEIFARAVAGYVQRHGYDGVEFDLEDWISQTTATPQQINRFVNIVHRRLLPMGGIFLTSAGFRDWDRYWAATDTSIEAHNLQTYAYWQMWCSSFNIPWFMTPTHSEANSCSQKSQSLEEQYDAPQQQNIVARWNAHGHPLNKVGIGVGAYGGAALGTTSPTGQYSSIQNDLFLRDVKAMLRYGGVLRWAPLAQSPYINGTATAGNPLGISTGTQFYITYNDESNIGSKIRWADSVGAGSVMIYSIEKDLRLGQTTFATRFPTVAAAAAAIASLGGIIPPPPPPPAGATYDTISVATMTSTNYVRSLCNDTTVPFTFQFGIQRITTGGANVTVTIPAFIFTVPQGQTAMTFNMTKQVRIQK